TFSSPPCRTTHDKEGVRWASKRLSFDLPTMVPAVGVSASARTMRSDMSHRAHMANVWTYRMRLSGITESAHSLAAERCGKDFRKRTRRIRTSDHGGEDPDTRFSRRSPPNVAGNRERFESSLGLRIVRIHLLSPLVIHHEIPLRRFRLEVRGFDREVKSRR